MQNIAIERSITPDSILDFGSGYGRVSRFLPSFFTNSKIEVSEVKSQALDFQKRHFDFEGISHTQDVKSFPDKEFDLILALSVFTHLPQSSFENWLNKLVRLLKPGGALVFTFNNTLDPLHLTSSQMKEFAYTASSEDTAFPFLYDSIKENTDYGNTYVSHRFLDQLISKLGVDHKFLGKELVPSQEAIIVMKK